MAHEKQHILVAEDSSTQAQHLKWMLEDSGFRVSIASNGKEAIKLMGRENIAVVITDILMPEMDGYGVLEHMKNDEYLRDVPVIIVSAVDEFESALRCIEMGADDYLLKPYNPALLKARITACLEKGRLRDREQRLHKELAEVRDILKKVEDGRDALFHMIVRDIDGPLSGMLETMQRLLRDIEKGGDIESENFLKRFRHVRNTGEALIETISKAREERE